jgi:hypothetical protein
MSKTLGEARNIDNDPPIETGDPGGYCERYAEDIGTEIMFPYVCSSFASCRKVTECECYEVGDSVGNCAPNAATCDTQDCTCYNDWDSNCKSFNDTCGCDSHDPQTCSHYGSSHLVP